MFPRGSIHLPASRTQPSGRIRFSQSLHTVSCSSLRLFTGLHTISCGSFCPFAVPLHTVPCGTLHTFAGSQPSSGLSAFARPLSLRPASRSSTIFLHTATSGLCSSLVVFPLATACDSIRPSRVFPCMPTYGSTCPFIVFLASPQRVAAVFPFSSCTQFVTALALLQPCTQLLVAVFVACDLLQQHSLFAIGGFGCARSLSLSPPRTAQHMDTSGTSQSYDSQRMHIVSLAIQRWPPFFTNYQLLDYRQLYVPSCPPSSLGAGSCYKSPLHNHSISSATAYKNPH